MKPQCYVHSFQNGSNHRSRNKRIMSIISVLLSFVANDINHDADNKSATNIISQQIFVVQVATASPGQKHKIAVIGNETEEQENAKRAYIQYD